MTTAATEHGTARADPAPGAHRALAVVPVPAAPQDRATAPPVPRLRLLRYEPDPDDLHAHPAARLPVVQPVTCPPPAPDDPRETAVVRRRAQQVLRLALEVLDGRRPLTHLAPHVEPPVLRYVRVAHAQRPTLRQPSRMTSVHVGRPCPGVAEVAAVYRRGDRARALAARFEGGPPGDGADHPGRWRCVTLRLL